MADIRQKAAAYINIKPRTEKQVERYLRDKGFDDGEISDVIDELKEYRYIDDMDYSVMYFEYGFEKGRGVMRIKRELAEKGVDGETIDRAYESLEDVPDQYEAALRIAESAAAGADIGSMEYAEKRRLLGRIGRKLESRGFTADTIYKVIDSLK